jgi:hypothetical protein
MDSLKLFGFNYKFGGIIILTNCNVLPLWKMTIQTSYFAPKLSKLFCQNISMFYPNYPIHSGHCIVLIKTQRHATKNQILLCYNS